MHLHTMPDRTMRCVPGCSLCPTWSSSVAPNAMCAAWRSRSPALAPSAPSPTCIGTYTASARRTWVWLGRWAQQGVQLLRLGPEPHIAWSFKGGRLRARFSCITARNPTPPQLAPTACSHGLVGTLGPVGFWYACQAEAFQAATQPWSMHAAELQHICQQTAALWHCRPWAGMKPTSAVNLAESACLASTICSSWLSSTSVLAAQHRPQAVTFPQHSGHDAPGRRVLMSG